MVGGARVHGVRYGRQSLALDMVEAFRQPIVDRLTLRVLNLRRIQPDDFEGGQQGTRLLPDALKRYLSLYDEQMRSESTARARRPGAVACASRSRASPRW